MRGSRPIQSWFFRIGCDVDYGNIEFSRYQGSHFDPVHIALDMDVHENDVWAQVDYLLECPLTGRNDRGDFIAKPGKLLLRMEGDDDLVFHDDDSRCSHDSTDSCRVRLVGFERFTVISAPNWLVSRVTSWSPKLVVPAKSRSPDMPTPLSLTAVGAHRPRSNRARRAPDDPPEAPLAVLQGLLDLQILESRHFRQPRFAGKIECDSRFFHFDQ